MSKQELKKRDSSMIISSDKDLMKFKKIASQLSEGYHMHMKPAPMIKLDPTNEETFTFISEATSKELNNKALTTIERILKELIEGAYQDRMIAHTLNNSGSLKIMDIQQLRQRADNHLLKMIKAYSDFKRPPIKVTVNKVDQVNISDKQVNINTNDLDKNEKLS